MEKTYTKKTEKLSVIDVPNGIVLPRQQVVNGPRWGLGGICDASNQFVEESYYDGGWASHGGSYQWTDESVKDESVVYIGLLFNHWGHFLVDLTTRLWAIPIILEKDPSIKVAYLGEEEPQGNILEFFSYLGISSDRLAHITVPTRFKHVYVPEQSFKSCDWYTDEHVRLLDCVVSNALCNCTDSKLKDIKKVYFTRRQFGKALASEFGEEYFEKTFKANGFTVLAPESLSLSQQVFIWNNADSIAALNGSIPLNVLFCQNEKLKLTVLNKTSLSHENPYILLYMRTIMATFIDVYKEPLKHYPESLGAGPFLLWSTKDFLEYCSQNNISCSDNINVRIYFMNCQIKYFWSIIGLRRRIWLFIRKLLLPIYHEFKK